MMYVIGVGLIMLLAVVIVALNYRGKAAAEKRHAELQKQRADVAETINSNRQQLDTALATLHNAQREETIHANTPENLARRTDFNNDWSGDTGLLDTSADATRATGAAAAGSTCAAADIVNGTDLCQ